MQDDGHVGCVEELDGVGRILAALAGRLDRQVHAEALQRTNTQSIRSQDSILSRLLRVYAVKCWEPDTQFRGYAAIVPGSILTAYTQPKVEKL